MITDYQRERRKFHIGSSDAAAIVGANPWRGAADVYWDKINPPTENENKPNSEAIIIGNLCEGAVLDWFSMETGKEILRNQRRIHENAIMAANFDAIVVGENEAVEAKTTGIVGYLDKDEWGEPGTDEVPEHVIIQCQHQMAVLPEIKLVWVPALMGGIGFRLYRVERNNDLIQSLETIEVDFWKKYVETRTPPPDNLPTIDTIKSIKREPQKVVAIDDELIRSWLDAKKALSAAKKESEEAQRAVLAALGDAEGGECSFGRLTYFQQKRNECFVPASTFRVARFKENKEVANG